MFADQFDFGDEGGGEEGGEEGGDTSNAGPKVGDYYFVKDGRGGKYYVLQSDGGFRKTNRKPTTGNQFSKSDFSPVVENIKQNNTPPPPGGSGEERGRDNIDGKEVSFLNLNESIGGDSNFINNMFSPSDSIAMNTSGLQGRDRFTFIDMTTKKGKENLDAQNGGSGSQFDDSILDGDPSRGPGYEVFLSGATV